jgi:GcrA cell cycle regulator
MRYGYFDTDEKIAALKELWADSGSARMIAAELHNRFGGLPSRNMVIGQARRLGLGNWSKRRVPSEVQKPKPKPRVKRRAPFKPAASWPAPTEPLPSQPFADGVPLTSRCSLMELTSRTCRFPFGDVGEPGFFFCGVVPVDSFPYCAEHCRVAYAGTMPHSSYSPRPRR